MISNFLVNLNEYSVERIINRGTFGNVYLVHKNNNPEMKYAAKVSRDEIENNADQERFFKDITPLSIIKNPAILNYHGFNLQSFNGESRPTILMDLMPNGSLRDLITNQPDFPLSKKYIILLGIAKGMNHLHINGIIHRDLKPENVLLDQNFYPRICDFGESKIADTRISEVLMSTYRGTYGYMAPEIFQHEGKYTYKIDIFAFAIVTYELITGINPYVNQTSFRIMSDLANGKRPDLSPIQSIHLQKLIKKSWSQNPLDRPTFSQIITEISQKEFKETMCADEDEVQRYLSLFNIENQYSENPLTIEIQADEGDVDSMLKFANMQLLGNKVPVNKKKAAQYYKMAADNGNVDAMYRYGHMLYIGHGISKSFFGSCSYYRKANSRNDANAMFRFANALYHGIGFPVDKNIAIEYYKKAADRGNEEASYICGYLSYNGNEVRMKKQEAANYFKIASDKGRPDAMHNYANMLFNGDGIKANKTEALRYYKMAADLDHTDSCFIYGTFLYFGTETEAEADKLNSSHYFKKAADKGNIHAMYNYATMLYNGDGIPVNRTEAMKYYEMASKKNDHEAVAKVAKVRSYKEVFSTK